MNYYKRHVGDYAKKAGHLSILEHGIYTLLLDAYYDREQGPTKAEAARWSRARTDDELAALQAVLADFFTYDGERYTQSRVEQEFVLAAELAKLNAEKGKLGGRPRKAAHKPEKSRRVSEQKPEQSPEKPNPLIHQSTNQVSQKQEPASPSGSRLQADWALPAGWREWAEAERPDLDIQREADSFADYWHGVAGAKGRKADWQATWRNWVRRADGLKRRAEQRPEPSKRLSAIHQLEAMKHGLDDPRNIDRLPKAAVLGIGQDASD